MLQQALLRGGGGQGGFQCQSVGVFLLEAVRRGGGQLRHGDLLRRQARGLAQLRQSRLPAQLGAQAFPGGVDGDALLPEAPAYLDEAVVPEVPADLPGDLGYGVGGKLGAVVRVKAPDRLEKPQTAQLVQVVRLHALAEVPADYRPDEAAVLLQHLRRGGLVPLLGQGQEIQGAGGHWAGRRGWMRRRMVTRVPFPSWDRTARRSMKLSMIVKPMPLRSSPPVV